MSALHTPGPWRFEFNAEHRSVHLVGGRPQYDLTIMNFCRWGMGRATMLLRDTAHDGMNIMHKLHDRPDWIAPEPGREHHKSWFQLLTHPDIRLIEAAPDLLEALKADGIRRCWPMLAPTVPHQRLTMSRALLASAKHKILSISGQSKLTTLSFALAGDDVAEMPVRAFLQPTLEIYWCP